MKSLNAVLRAASALVLCSSAFGQEGPDIYVDADSQADPPTGTSWPLAYPTLWEALEAADQGDVIWVAEGTYTAETSSDSLVIDKQLIIMGGYLGDGDTRDVETYVTVLSGDHGQSQWSETVLFVEDDENSFVEGFTIQDGVGGADGAGIKVGDASHAPTIRFEDCIVTDNSTAGGSGGGVACLNAQSQSQFWSCQISDNIAVHTDSQAGGVFSGLRWAEAKRLHVRDIRRDEDGYTLVIGRGKGKVDRGDVVELPEELAPTARGLCAAHHETRTRACSVFWRDRSIS